MFVEGRPSELYVCRWETIRIVLLQRVTIRLLQRARGEHQTFVKGRPLHFCRGETITLLQKENHQMCTFVEGRPSELQICRGETIRIVHLQRGDHQNCIFVKGNHQTVVEGGTLDFYRGETITLLQRGEHYTFVEGGTLDVYF